MIEESLLKSNFTGRDGFIWWIGQIAPPSVWRNEKSEIDEDSGWAYRCKVRIVGYHTFKGDVLPDEDLPWAHVMVDPVDGSGQGGLAKKHNLVGGETAFGFFLDGEDAQQPVVVGLIYRNKSTENLITPELIAQEKSSGFKPFTGNQGNMARKMTQIRKSKTGTQSTPTTPDAPPAIVGGNTEPEGPSPVPNSVPPSDPSADQIFTEDSALDAVLKEALPLKIQRENGCSSNAIGKITQVLQDFIAVINGLQKYQSTYIDPILNKAFDITNQIKSTASKIAGLLKGMINVMRSTIIGLVSKIFREVVALIVPEPQVPITAEVNKNIHNLIFCLFEKLLDFLLDFLEDMLTGLVGKAISVPLCAAEEWIAAVLGKMLELLDDLLEPILSGLSWLSGALGQVSSILSTVEGIANKILSFIGCDELKCDTPSEWAMAFGPSDAEADNWNRVLDNLDVLKSFGGGIDEATSYLSLYGFGDNYFSNCSKQTKIAEPPPGIKASSCRPPKVSIFGGGGTGASAIPIVSSEGQIISVEILSGGIGYKNTPTVKINDKSNYGKGARVAAIVENGSITSIYVIKPGRDYCPADYTSLFSTPYYLVTANKYSFIEGEIITFTVQGYELNTNKSRNLTYNISGLEEDGVDGADLSGSITLNESGSFNIQIRPLEGSLTADFTKVTFDLYDYSSSNVAQTSVMISNIDYSPITIVTKPQSPPGNDVEVQGIQGITGKIKLQGILDKQAQGLQGLQGTQTTGLISTIGISTFIGLQGTTGVGLTAGLQGISLNLQGIKYGNDFQGIQGLFGTQEIQGIQGIQGIVYTPFPQPQPIPGTLGEPIGDGIPTSGIQGIQGLQGISGPSGETVVQGIQGITGIPVITGIGITGTEGPPSVFPDGIVVVSPGVGYTSGDKIVIGGISTFIPLTTPNGSIIGAIPDSNFGLPSANTFDEYPTIQINTLTGEGAAVFPILKLKRKSKVAPLIINQSGILSVVDCI
jgi:hypothetical protein